MYLQLFKDTVVLLAIVFLVSYIKSLFSESLRRFEGLLVGLTYGTVGILTMNAPFSPVDGINLDGRAAFVAIAGIFGGTTGATIAGAACIAYRLHLGGSGVPVGIIGVFIAAGVGVWIRSYLKKRHLQPGPLILLGCGYFMGMANLIFASSMLDSVTPELLPVFLPFFFIVLPATVLIFGLFEVHEAQRRERERLIRENESIFENIQKIGQIGVWIYWPERNEFKLSSQVYRMMGQEPPAKPFLSTSAIATRIHQEDIDMLRSRLKRLAIGEPTPGVFQFRAVRKDGTVRTLSSYRISSKDAPGIYEGTERVFAGILQDTTERTELFDQLAHSARLATIGELASGIGHEINNPLTAAMLFTDRIERMIQRSDPPNQDIVDLLGRLSQRLQGISSLIRSMTSFVRQEPRQMRALDAHGVIMDTVAIFNDLVPSGRLSVEIDLLAAQHEIFGDPARLQQVLMNLLTNARDATEGISPALVRIQTSSDAEEFEISIEDNGAGIPEDVQQRIFEPFFTTKERGRGTGLGLSLASSIVENMSGRIELHSAVGKGTTFKLKFPLLKA